MNLPSRFDSAFTLLGFRNFGLARAFGVSLAFRLIPTTDFCVFYIYLGLEWGGIDGIIDGNR